MDKLKLHTPDLAEANFRKLAELFPNAVTETITGYTTDKDGNEKPIIERAIDTDVLRQEISAEVVEGRQERYQFTWPDKKKSVVLANAPIAKTLRLDRSRSVGRDGASGSIDTENIYIEGDNLDALKLLQETYLGKVKMIYIDPPYNTGSDSFVYEDDSSISGNEFAERSGQYDENGNLLFDIRPNNESNGRFHTDWLNMLYPRLRIAKDFLSNDGVIFISIDDNEVENLRKICDEIFGKVNFFCQIIVQHNKRGQTYKQISKTHEYLLVYTKSSNSEFNELEKDLENSDLNLIDRIGPYNVRELRNRNPKFGRHNRPNLFYPIYVNTHEPDKDGFCPVSMEKYDGFCEEVLPYNSAGIDSCWRWGTALCLKNISPDTQASNLVARRRPDGKYNIYEKYRKTTYKPKSIWTETDVITEKGTVELGQLGMSTYFDFPKPIGLLRKCLQIGTNFGDVILDFFSGSATTAHAAMQLNAEDGSNRKFIMVQLPEITGEKSEARKAGYETICDIGEERIRRAGKKIREETGADIDYGFRVFRVDSTNMEDVYYRPDEYDQSLLGKLADNIKPDRTPEDLLFQVMLDLGVLLSSSIEETEIAGKKVFSVAGGYLLACFDKDVSEETVTEIAKRHPFYAVFRDSSMANDSVAVNFDQIFETYSPKTERRVL